MLSADDTLADVLAMCVETHEVGSRVTCKPPPTDTDRDVLRVVVSQGRFMQAAVERGFEVCGYVPRGADEVDIDRMEFVSLRRGEANLIVTDKRRFAEKFMLATRTAARLNLMRKEDRVTLFQAILYENG